MKQKIKVLNDILSQYNVQYHTLNGAGAIDYKGKNILINPYFDDDVGTLMHMIVHHHYDETLKQRIEDKETETIAQQLLRDRDIYQFLNNYRINNEHNIFSSFEYNSIFRYNRKEVPKYMKGCNRPKYGRR